MSEPTPTAPQSAQAETSSGGKVGFKRNPTYERWRWQIFSITWLAYAGLYLVRKAFSIAKTALKDPAVMGLSKGDMSWIEAINSAAYAVGQFGWGALGDRFGPRIVVTIGLLGSVTVAIASGMSNTMIVLFIFLGLQGFFQASGWAPLSKNVGEFFSRRERGSVMGFWCTNYALGAFAGGALAGFAAQRFGWRYAFFVPAGVLLLIWGLFLLFQRNRPEDVGLPAIEKYKGESEAVIDPRETPAQEVEGSWHVTREVFKNKTVWMLGAVYFLVKPARYLLMAWSPLYVNERLGTGAMESGFISGLFDLAGPIGTLAGGIASDRIFSARRMPVCVMGLFAVAAAMIAFPFLPATRWAVSGGIFLIGFLLYIPDSMVSGAAAIDFGTKKGASTASGLINGCGSTGQIIGVILPGLMEAIVGKGKDIWNPIFLCLGISLALAGLILLPQWNRVPPTAKK